MLDMIRGHVDYLVKNKSLRDGDEVYLFITMELALAFAGLSHLGLIVLYAAAKLAIVAWCNVLCCLVMIVGLVLVRSGRYYYPAGMLMSLAVLSYGVASHFLTGFNTFNVMYVMLGLASIIVVPFAPHVQRAIPALLMLASAIGTTVLGFSPPPPLYAMDQGATIALAVYNVTIGFVGLAVVLAVVTTVKKALADHTEDKLGDMINKANSDTLTGLYNRRYAHIYFDNLIHSPAGEVWCVAMLDVDNFKRLNDEYGHLAGDKVLSTLAEIMQTVLRSTDSIFRWGGEEFLLVLKGTSLKNATQVLERMLKTIEATPIEAEGHTLYITATVGVTVLDLKNIQTSIDKCDARLYIGKRSGKNKVVSTG